MELGTATGLLALAGVFPHSFDEGAFGGGFAIIGIPLLSLVMDPLTAGALLAPLCVAMELVALRYWKPSTRSRPDLKVLLPSLLAGIGPGYIAPRILDARAVAIVMALITLAFTLLWFRTGGEVRIRSRATAKAVAAGVGSGVTTMVAPSGGPPLAMYLLPLGMAKQVYAGTTSLFFHRWQRREGATLATTRTAKRQDLVAHGNLPAGPFLPTSGSAGCCIASSISFSFIGPGTHYSR